MPPSKKDQRIDGILTGAKQILDATKDILSFCPVPGLPGAVSTLSTLIDMVLKERGNKETRRELAKNINELASIIEKTVKQINSIPETDNNMRSRLATSSELEERIATLNRDLDDLTNMAEELEDGFLGFLLSKKNADTLTKIRTGVDSAIRKFLIDGEISIELLVNGIVNNQLHEFDEKALENLPHVNAGYSSALNPTKSGTLQGTRTLLLEELTAWTLRPDSNRSSSFIYVISGGAGTGKSTIAFEMAQRLEEVGALGASFFFVRGADKLNTTTHVLTTIAYQLARNQKELYPLIATAAREYSKKGKQGEQLQVDLYNLIITPLMNARTSHHPVTIVLDALDECTRAGQDEVVRLLYLFMEQLPRILFPFRVLVTTRPEMHIEAALNTENLRQVSKPYRLHEIPRSIVDQDVKLFLEAKLKDLSCYEIICSARRNAIEDLTKLAAGLFIYADTVVKFLGKNPHHAVEILDALLSDNASGAAFSLKNLDRLYIAVLQNALDDDGLDIPHMREYIQLVLGSLSLLQDHMSTAVLHDLVGVPMRFIRDILGRLGSVILKPERDDIEIRMLHASFPQFLIDNKRCDNPVFYIDPSVHHHRLASTCLELMTVNFPLRRNICNLEDPTIMKLDIPDLQDRIKKCIPGSLQYSCIHWATHLSQSNVASPVISNMVTEFTRTKLMAWLEMLSFMDRLEVAVPALLAAMAWCEIHIQGEHETLQLMDDAYRLVSQFYAPIDDCPEHIYTSGLQLAPTCILTTRYNQSNRPTSKHPIITLMTPRDSAWGHCLHTTPVGLNDCRAMLSPDGMLIAAGASDANVRIWDASIGSLKRTLGGHIKDVKCVAWAPDGQSLASGSADGTFRIWNAVSGGQIHVQRVQGGHCKVYFIAWNQDGSRVVTGSNPGGVQVWNIDLGKEIQETIAIPTMDTVMVISKDISRAVDKTEGGRLRLWDISCSNGRILKELRIEFYIFAAVFLHNDTQVVFCGINDAIHLWDLQSGDCIPKVKLESRVTYMGKTHIIGISASQMGDIVVSSTLDNIHFFNSTTWESLGSFRGFFSLTASFSPDCRRLVSSYNDIQTWDASAVLSPKSKFTPSQSSPTSSAVMKHDSPIYFVTISLDGSRVAALSKGTVSIWFLQSGTLCCTLQGDFAGDATFSPGGREIAVGAYRKIFIWDITSAEPSVIRTIASGNDWNDVITWSPDGRWICGAAYGPGTKGLGIFDAMTGQMEKYLPFRNEERLWEVEFSKDSTLLYVGSSVKDVIFIWKEGDTVDLEQNKWVTEIQRRGLSYQDGWILRERDSKRLCWVQAGYVHMFARWGNYYAVGKASGQLDILYIEDSSVGVTTNL